MSDKDLVRRGNVRREIAKFISHNTSLVDEWAANCIDDIVDAIPAVQHEMTARELFSVRDRMCNSNYNGGHMTPACKTCPLWRDNNGHDMYCGTLMTLRPLDFVALVEKWAREHPEERSEE